MREARIHVRHVRDLLKSIDYTDAYAGQECSSLAFLNMVTQGDILGKIMLSNSNCSCLAKFRVDGHIFNAISTYHSTHTLLNVTAVSLATLRLFKLQKLVSDKKTKSKSVRPHPHSATMPQIDTRQTNKHLSFWVGG